MFKVFQLLTMATIGIALASGASAEPTYTNVDVPGAIGTLLQGGPNPEGTNIGAYLDQTGPVHGFTLEKGVLTTIDPPGSAETLPAWISPQGTVVGQYYESNGVGHGFLLKGGTFTTLDFPGAYITWLGSLSPSGELVGGYCTDANSCANSLIHCAAWSPTGVLSSCEPPGATASLGAGNPSGTIAGSYSDGPLGLGGNTHGYVLDHGKFTTIDYPGAISTDFGAINPAGTITGAYTDTAGVVHAFVLRRGTFTSFDYPGAIATYGGGINPAGVVVGTWFDAALNQHGFIRTP